MTPQQAKDSAEYFYSCAAAENPCESVRCSYLAAVKGAGISYRQASASRAYSSFDT